MTEQKTRTIGPYTRPHRLVKLDRRTKIYRRWREIVEGLVAHCGTPSATQRENIESLAFDMLRLDVLRQKAIDGGLTDHDRREMSMLRTHERLGLRELGVEAAEREPRSIIDMLDVA